MPNLIEWQYINGLRVHPKRRVETNAAGYLLVECTFCHSMVNFAAFGQYNGGLPGKCSVCRECGLTKTLRKLGRKVR